MPLAARHFSKTTPVWIGLFLWAFQWLLVLAMFASLVLTFTVDRGYGIAFFIAGGLTALVVAIRYAQSRSVSCPLCHGRILHGSKCHKHRDARRRALLSHTSTLFVDVALKGRFVCMYCGTPFRMKR